MNTFNVNDGTAKFDATQTELILAIKDRLVNTYWNAPADVRAEGAKWYTGKGAGLARDVAAECGITFKQAAAIVAVCSPRTRWSMQVRNTAPMVKHFQQGGDAATAPAGALFVSHRAKAAQVLAGDFSPLNGPKVGPFFRNICGDWSVVTIDVWAVRAAIGEAEVDRWVKGKRRSILEAAYHLAAEACGVDVAALQAVCWVVIRGASE